MNGYRIKIARAYIGKEELDLRNQFSYPLAAWLENPFGEIIAGISKKFRFTGKFIGITPNAN